MPNVISKDLSFKKDIAYKKNLGEQYWMAIFLMLYQQVMGAGERLNTSTKIPDVDHVSNKFAVSSTYCSSEWDFWVDTRLRIDNGLIELDSTYRGRFDG